MWVKQLTNEFETHGLVDCASFGRDLGRKVKQVATYVTGLALPCFAMSLNLNASLACFGRICAASHALNRNREKDWTERLGRYNG